MAVQAEHSFFFFSLSNMKELLLFLQFFCPLFSCGELLVFFFYVSRENDGY